MIRIPAVIILLMSFHMAWGGSNDTTAKEISAASLAAREDSSLVPKKICSCQLMNVKTNKFETQLVGIFAEKTLEGKKSSNYKNDFSEEKMEDIIKGFKEYHLKNS